MNELILQKITRETLLPLWIFYMENVPYDSVVRVAENEQEFIISGSFYKQISRCF